MGRSKRKRRRRKRSWRAGSLINSITRSKSKSKARAGAEAEGGKGEGKGEGERREGTASEEDIAATVTFGVVFYEEGEFISVHFYSL